jgi:hypothetical protein
MEARSCLQEICQDKIVEFFVISLWRAQEALSGIYPKEEGKLRPFTEPLIKSNSFNGKVK